MPTDAGLIALASPIHPPPPIFMPLDAFRRRRVSSLFAATDSLLAPRVPYVAHLFIFYL